MSELKVNKVSPRSGTAFTLGDSGDTFTVPSGAILTTTDATVNLPATQTVATELKTNKISPASGTAFTFGDSGDTFTIPSGATIANNGTATGFGDAGLTLINKTSGTSDVSNFSVDNVFTSTYDNYKVVMNMRNSDTGGFYLRLLKSDGSERNSGYTTLDGRQIGTTGNFEDNGSSTNVSTYYIGRHSGSDIGGDTVYEITFISPFLSSEETTMITRGYGYHDSQNGYLQIFSTSRNSNAETHRGFKFVSNTGNINPHTVRVYGYKNDV